MGCAITLYRGVLRDNRLSEKINKTGNVRIT